MVHCGSYNSPIYDNCKVRSGYSALATLGIVTIVLLLV